MRAAGAGFVEEYPDHRRHAAIAHAFVHRSDIGDQMRQLAAESVRVIDGGIAQFRMRGVIGRKQYPAADMRRPSPESAQCRADEIQRLGMRTRRGGIVFRFLRRIGGQLPSRTARARQGVRQGDRRNHAIAELDCSHVADPIACAATAVVVIVIHVQHRLHRVFARLELGEGGRESERLGIDDHTGAGRQMGHFHRGDADLCRFERAGIDRDDLAVLGGCARFGGGHREQQQAAGYRLGRITCELHAQGLSLSGVFATTSRQRNKQQQAGGEEPLRAGKR